MRITLKVAASAFAALLIACNEQPTMPGRSGNIAADRGTSLQTGPYLNRYIVVFNDGVTDIPGLARSLTTLHGGTVRHIFEHALHGFSATFPSGAADALRRHPAVAYVEENKPIVAVNHTTQANAPWGLDRIDQRSLPLNIGYDYTATGSGVRVYIIDSGLRTTHAEFGGRASVGIDERPEDGQNGQDCAGHGTMVGGIVGGSVHGTAKNVLLIAVRVLDCEGGGSLDDLIAGFGWVAAHRVTPAVANVSIAVTDQSGNETTSQLVDIAMNGLINSGVTVSIAAGNTNKSACDVSPARVAAALTVGATTSGDVRASFSNFGNCVDLFAPGVGITSASIGSDNDTNTDSGTSYAAPFAGGVAALYLQSHSAATPSQVITAITSHATSGKLSSIGTGSPNLLLHSLFVDASISGPSSIYTPGTYTWQVNPSGGHGSGYTYKWEVTWTRTGQTWQLGTSQTQALGLSHTEGSFTLYATVKNLNSDFKAFKFVYNGF